MHNPEFVLSNETHKVHFIIIIIISSSSSSSSSKVVAIKDELTVIFTYTRKLIVKDKMSSENKILQ